MFTYGFLELGSESAPCLGPGSGSTHAPQQECMMSVSIVRFEGSWERIGHSVYVKMAFLSVLSVMIINKMTSLFYSIDMSDFPHDIGMEIDYVVHLTARIRK